MASVTSLGIHKPSALPFLVAEGILPPDPSEELYTWQTIHVHDIENGDIDEELISTNHCVVWSRASVIQRIFRLEVERETITQAVFTCFPGKGGHQNDDPTASLGQSQLHKRGTMPNVEKSDRDRRASTPKSGQDASRLNTNPMYRQANDATNTKPSNNGSNSENRALVVVLTTKAHVFFLTGTSCIVHLPFEVENVFPIPHGLLVQRKISTPISNLHRPRIPSVPPNSFAFSQVRSSGILLNPSGQDESSSFREQDLLTDTEFPRLFSLTDPLAEIGVVISSTGSASTDLADQGEVAAPLSVATDIRESLLFVSSKDELQHYQHDAAPTAPCLLAVTENQVAGVQNVWKMTYVGVESTSDSQRRAGSNSSGRTSRRRSSFGPGIRTGATTPIARGRESLGVGKTRNQSFRAIAVEDNFEKAEEDLISQLGPTSENQNAPTKSSRRVSSLIARADLFASHDRSTFSELASGYPVPGGSRRGASFDAQGARSSLIKDGPPTQRKYKGARSSIDPTITYEQLPKNMFDDDDNLVASLGFDKLGLDNTVRSFRKEIVLTKLHSIPINCADSRQPPRSSKGPAQSRIFTLKAPDHMLTNNHDNIDLFLCVFDCARYSLLAVPVKVQHRGTKSLYDFDQETLTQADQKVQTCKILLGKPTRSNNIIDACKFRDGDYSRILVISESVNGSCELSLQAPWSSAFKIQLPTSLALYNPYQTNGNSIRQKREGSSKRILSDGPRAFAAIQHEGSRGRVDVVDEAGRRHRIQVQLKPHSPHIQKIIKVSESVIPHSAGERDTVLQDWWSVASWLRTRSDAEIDIEWTALVVVLFTVTARLTDDRRAETSTRQKRRKTGLLRSSSGAITDLESWENMWNEESNLSTSPSWVQDIAWKWTVSQNSIHNMAKSSLSRRQRTSDISKPSVTPLVPIKQKSTYLIHCLSLARDFLKSSVELAKKSQSEYLPYALSQDPTTQTTVLATLVLSLHLLREEFKLDVLAACVVQNLSPVIAQIGGWLGWDAWGFSDTSYYMLENVDMHSWLFDESIILKYVVPPAPFSPSSILHFIEKAYLEDNVAPFESLLDIAKLPIAGLEDRGASISQRKLLSSLTPRTVAISNLLVLYPRNLKQIRAGEVNLWQVNPLMVETLPEGVAVAFRAVMNTCQNRPSTTWNANMLKTTDRGEKAVPEFGNATFKPSAMASVAPLTIAVGDVHNICGTTFEVEPIGAYDGSAEGDRLAITRSIFKDDQRFTEAARLLHPLNPPVARCAPEPDWSDTELLEAQQELAKIIALRTSSVSVGRGLLFYCARMPLLTEKFPIHGFTLSCVMTPANTTVTADRNSYTEEKVSWAFFHAGVEAGLSISKMAKGIDTSWINFNKPHDLKNRHAGFLLALGLNGHLKSIATHAIFNYLNPKHTMTSIGFLLGLSASYLGTMDVRITKVLSIHVMRMLPPGTAELNHSPLTQTSGIMGIGLLYCNTQHRRMSEVMISEMENVEYGDNSSPLDSLRDEGYRLAAGFALGYINLGRGKDSRGLHDMHIVERLLTLAVGTRKVGIVHILDKATAAATVAVALMFMKTQDGTIARKIDIPDTIHQFDYVRPDIFLLRTVARHLIMWDDIRATTMWMKKQLPSIYQHKLKLSVVRVLNTEDMPFLNIVAGLCLSIGLRFAGSGSLEVRKLLCYYLDQFMRICKLPSMNYDGKLSRITVRNCQDAVALAAACVMAGTGDLVIFRRLRALHGRTDVDTPYGSHLAAHLAVGILFLGGGTYTFGTSNLAIASLLCAFYPLFPNAVLDNKSHLQAFRHFWVLAAEPRCLVIRDADTGRPLSVGVTVTVRDKTNLEMTAPCLLPGLETIEKIQTDDSEYWRIILDFSTRPNDIETFKRSQSIYVRRRTAYDANASTFSITMQSLNDSQSALRVRKQAFEWILALPVFGRLDRAEKALILPPNATTHTFDNGTRGTVVDDRLVLETGCISSGKSEKLWNLRVLFTWAEGLSRRGEKWSWFGKEVVEGLRAALELTVKINHREER